MQNIRILLADKNLSYLEVAKKMLNFHDDNYAIDVATTGAECFEKLLDNHYDLILLDYDIDNKKGLDVLNRIIRSGLELPVVMMVEEGREEIAFESLEHGASDYIMKVRGYLTALPFTVGKVLEREKLKEKKNNKPKFELDQSDNDNSTEEKEEAYYLLDRRGRFISANKNLETISQYTEAELLELTISDLIPREQESKYNQWISTLDLGYNSNSYKTEIIGKYGNRKAVEILLNPVRDQNGDITSYKGKLIFPKNSAQEKFPVNGAFDQTRMIQDMVEIIHTSYNDSLNHLLQRITKTICQLFQFQRATLALLDRRRKVFVKQTMVGYLNNNHAEKRLLEVPQDIIERIFTDQFKIKVMYFDQNAQSDSHALASEISERRTHPRRTDHRWHPNDMIILNLIDKEQKTFGYISIDKPIFENAPPRELFFNLELFCNLASLAIENYYRFATVEKRNRRLKQLLVTSNIFKLHLSLNEMLNEIVWSIKFTLDYNLVVLGLISKRSGNLEIKSVACDDKIKGMQIKELKFPVNSLSQLFKKQYKRGKSYFIEDEEPVLRELKDIYYHQKEHVTGDRYWHWWALLLVPIRNRENKIIGFLMVDDPADCMTPPMENIHTLEILATQIAIAIENRLIYLELKEKMIHHPTSSFQMDSLNPDSGIKKFVDRIFK